MKPGIYDLLVTAEIQRALEKMDPATFSTQLLDLEEPQGPVYLARHLLRQIKTSLEGLPAERRLQRQVELANHLLTFLGDECGEQTVAEDPQVLASVYTSAAPPKRPSTPLSQSDLIMNADGQSKLGFELAREMETADSVLMLVSFIQWRGWQRLRPAFEALALAGRPVRILTTTYIGASDYRALEAIARLPNVRMRISLDGRRRRLHAKAWLFQRLNGFSTAYVGSANLSGPALEDGIEWTVRLSEVETPHNLNRFQGAFETLWQDPEFEAFSPDDVEMSRRVEDALQTARLGPGRATSEKPLFFDLKPHPYQQATLDRLEAERKDRGQFRNLVVAPTGTGKTLVAAFDYARQIGRDGVRPRLLVLAHREELLKQARFAFRHVLRDESFGDLLAGGGSVSGFDYLFATIQSFHSQRLLERLGATYWEFVVVDEAHHVPAASYRELIAMLRPAILLGLTATPERMDGESILSWFGGQISDEMRLWHAIERQYLVPFDYFGIHDGTDLSGLSWNRGAYQVADLNRLYSGNQRRAGLVLRQFQEHYGQWREARTLGFCVSVEHARFMAREFDAAGIPALAVTSESPAEVRATAPKMLRDREVNVLFTVDLYNEGVDIPEVDCLLFLRPTESSTVFLQQMGRGLRLDTGKTTCLILDFIGNQRREFRYDLRFRALFGGTRQQVIRQLDSGMTRLPGNCYFRLDKESRARILENLRARLSGNRRRILAEIEAWREAHGRLPRLSEFLEETQYDLEDIYKRSVGGWGALIHGDGAEVFSMRLQHLLHVDSLRRLGLYERIVRDGWPVAVSEAERREALMATFRLLQSEVKAEGVVWRTGLDQARATDIARGEILEVLEVLRGRVRHHVEETPIRPEWPLYLHRRYTRDEILTAVGYKTLERPSSHREGVLWMRDAGVELLFVTLDKSDKQYSPTTQYEDFAVSPTQFHWQSQSTVREGSPTGLRYRNGEAKFLLLVRPKKGEAFTYLGPVQYLSHTGSRPMSIYWELETPMPAALFEAFASLRAA